MSDTEFRNAASFDAPADDVFGRIAGRYDLLCDLFSFGIHRIWKRRVAEAIAREPWSNLLDTATGTGDIVLRVLRSKADDSHRSIYASDLCPKMLAMAERRLAAEPGSVSWQVQNAERLVELSDESFDAYSMSLALKICDRHKVLREAFRVLRPGGRIILLEASRIRWPWLQAAYLGYMRTSMPIVGWLATGGDASAYLYLLRGIETFPSAEHLAEELADLGFVDVSYQRLTLGIVAIHTGRKPA